MNKWDVVLLRYPFSDLTTTKVRPALIISPDSDNSGEDATFIAITTNTVRAGTYDVAISVGNPQFAMTGLNYDSVIRVNKLFTLKQTLVAKRLGVIGASHQAEVSTQLGRFF